MLHSNLTFNKHLGTARLCSLTISLEVRGEATPWWSMLGVARNSSARDAC
jgi:hypothetical protein